MDTLSTRKTSTVVQNTASDPRDKETSKKKTRPRIDPDQTSRSFLYNELRNPSVYNELSFTSESQLNGVRVSSEEQEIQRRHREIITDLLKKFNMEECYKKYSTMNSAEMEIKPKEYSLECESDFQRLRARLIRLTGSPVIRLADNEYNKYLDQKLDEEYQKKLDRQEAALAENERKRVMKLYLDGLIPSLDVYDVKNPSKKSPRNKSDKTPTSRSEKSKRNGKKEPKVVIDEANEHSFTQAKTPETMVQSHDQYVEAAESGECEPIGEVSNQENESQSGNVSNENENENENVRDLQTRDSTCDDSGFTAASDLSEQNEDELVKKLKHEESLSGLYQIADELIARGSLQSS